MGKKYIIELEDKPFHKEDGDFLYRVKGFNSLVFDMTGIGKLTPYTEPDLEQVRKEAYRQGYDTGYGTKVNEFYEQGLIDAWECARKIVDCAIPYEALENYLEIGECTADVIKHLPASKAIEVVRQYEHGKEEIKVGDEIEAVSGKAVVVYVDDVDEHKVRYVYSNGVYAFNYIDKVTKTGRHFPEIAEVLEKMREE